MEDENILRIRVSNEGYEIFGTSFNPSEITEEEFLSKFSFGGFDEDDGFEDDEESDDEESDDEESDDDKKDISDYSIDSEILFDDMMFEVELNNKTIFGYDSLPSDINVIELDKKESYKNLINPSENEVSVVWLYYQNGTTTYFWNNIVDFDINKLKVYFHTRISEVESKEYKILSGLTYDDIEPDEVMSEGEPGSGIDGPYTF